MKKIIPFEKDIKFNTKIYCINSISLEHNLKNDNNHIKGDFIISGDYKESDVLLKNEPFIYNIPFEILLDEKYDDIFIDIDDFSYEVKDKDILNIKINVLCDLNIKEDKQDKEDIIEILDEELNNREIVEDIDDKEEIKTDNINNIIENINGLTEDYVTYHVHIFRENDTIENIIKLYNTKMDDLKEYNDLSKISIGSKIIIPSYEL